MSGAHWELLKLAIATPTHLCFCPPSRMYDAPMVRNSISKAPGVVARLKALGASVQGLLSEEEGGVLDALPTSMAAAKTSPVTPGSFRLMQKVVAKGSDWPQK